MKQDLIYSRKVTSYVIYICTRLFSKAILCVFLQHTFTKTVYYFLALLNSSSNIFSLHFLQKCQKLFYFSH